MASIGAVIAACSALATSSAASIVQIDGLYATGVDDNGVALAPGAIDTHYTVLETGTNPFVVSNPPASWLPNNATSMWIWQQANGQPANVTRTFRLSFDLTGLDASTASISGFWSTDNFGLDILINGLSTGNTANNFSSAFAFSINSGFVDGTNTLDFVVQDVGIISGFRVLEISGEASLIPAPATLVLMLTAGLMTRRRCRSSR